MRARSTLRGSLSAAEVRPDLGDNSSFVTCQPALGVTGTRWCDPPQSQFDSESGGDSYDIPFRNTCTTGITLNERLESVLTNRRKLCAHEESVNLIDLQQSLSTTSVSKSHGVPYHVSEDGDLQGGRQEVFHPRPMLGIPKCNMDALGEGNRNEGIGYRSHHRDVLGTEADDGP